MTKPIKSIYLKAFFDLEKRKKLIDISVNLLLPFVNQFEAIVVRGVSGISVGSILAHLLDKPLVIIRKDESAHSNLKYEGPTDFSKYLIVDDFYSTGDTLRKIKEQVSIVNPEATCSYVYFYLGLCLSYTTAKKLVKYTFDNDTSLILNKETSW